MRLLLGDGGAVRNSFSMGVALHSGNRFLFIGVICPVASSVTGSKSLKPFRNLLPCQPDMQ
eukprot:2426481-Amphidinium_carterae.1